MGVAAPVVVAEMSDWTALGGGNSGIVGDVGHTFGFHLAASEVGSGDYSRWRDPNGSDGPYVNWSYACAGDFSHRRDEGLRAKHRDVLARLMRGELPMICEFIGQPWADQPVYYWARWNGVGNCSDTVVQDMTIGRTSRGIGQKSINEHICGHQCLHHTFRCCVGPGRHTCRRVIGSAITWALTNRTADGMLMNVQIAKRSKSD